MWRLGVVVSMLVQATIVRAEPEPAPDAGGYPLELAARPLVLPDTAVEGSLLFEVLRHERSFFGAGATHELYSRLGVRGAFAGFEGEVRLRMFVTDDISTNDPTIPELQRERFDELFVAGRYALGGPDQSIGAELVAETITANSKVLSPRGVFQHKAHFSRASALVVAGAAGLDTRRDTVMDTTMSTELLVGELRLNLQAQLAPQVALESRATLVLAKDLSDEMSFVEEGVHQRYGLFALVAISPIVDVVAGVDVLSNEEDLTKLFTIGVAARRLP